MEDAGELAKANELWERAHTLASVGEALDLAGWPERCEVVWVAEIGRSVLRRKESPDDR